MMELPGERIAPFNTRQASLRQYPLHFLCGFAGAVLNDETGDLVRIPTSHQTPEIQSHLEQIIRNGNLTLSNNNRNHIFCKTKRHSRGQAERRHIRTNLLQLSGTKEGRISNTYNDGREPHQLPRRLRNTNSGPPHRKTTFQQRHFDTPGKIYVHRHQGFLLMHPYGTLRIFQHEN